MAAAFSSDIRKFDAEKQFFVLTFIFGIPVGQILFTEWFTAGRLIAESKLIAEKK